MKIDSPSELARELAAIVPAFAEIWDEGESRGYTDGDYTYHTVFQELSALDLTHSTTKQIKAICLIINDFISRGGDYENAASTCFLEHASQIRVRNMIKPYLSDAARTELR